MTVGAFQSRDDVGQDALPCLHIDGEDGQADAELHPNGPRTGSIVLQEEQDLVPKRRQLRFRDICAKVVGKLVSRLALSVARSFLLMGTWTDLAAQGRGSEDLRLGVCVGLQQVQDKGPGVFLQRLLADSVRLPASIADEATH